MQYINISNSSNTAGVIVGVFDKDYDLATKRLQLLQARWNTNEMELANNGSPLYTRDYVLSTLLDVYLKRGNLVAGPEIEYDFDQDTNSLDICSDHYVFKYLKEYHCE